MPGTRPHGPLGAFYQQGPLAAVQSSGPLLREWREREGLLREREPEREDAFPSIFGYAHEHPHRNTIIPGMFANTCGMIVFWLG